MNIDSVRLAGFTGDLADVRAGRRSGGQAGGRPMRSACIDSVTAAFSRHIITSMWTLFVFLLVLSAVNDADGYEECFLTFSYNLRKHLQRIPSISRYRPSTVEQLG